MPQLNEPREILRRSVAEQRLLDNECDTVKSDAIQGGLSYVHDIFYSGHKGYANYTNEELEQELREQGLYDDGAYTGVLVINDDGTGPSFKWNPVQEWCRIIDLPSGHRALVYWLSNNESDSEEVVVEIELGTMRGRVAFGVESQAVALQQVQDFTVEKVKQIMPMFMQFLLGEEE